jgi:predicted nucleotidyltransferase
VTQEQQLPQLTLLERVVAALKDDPYVCAAFLRGSFYSGRPDVYSDLDVFAVVDPANVETFCAQARTTLARADRVLSISAVVATPIQLRVLFPGPLRLDLSVVTPETLPLYVGWRILFDERELLKHRTRMAATHSALLPEHVVALCDEFWWNIFISVSWLKRGHIWMALRTLDSGRIGLTQLLRWRRDPAQPYEHLVDLERHLTVEDQQALAQTLAAYDLRSVVMALLAAADAFDPAAREVAARVGAEYPAELAQTVKQFFIREFWALIAPGPTISA